MNAREQMNERVTVIEGDRIVIWLARRIPRWVVLEDYHNGWTFEISTIARLYVEISLLTQKNFQNNVDHSLSQASILIHYNL